MSQRLVGPGSPDILGVTPVAGGIDVAVFSAHASAIEFCLFDGEQEVERITLPARTGDVFHGHIDGIGVGARYGLRAHGLYAPNDGHRFNPAKLLLDPYARAIDRVLRLDASMFGQDADASMSEADSAASMAKAIVFEPTYATPGHSLTPWSDTVIYELHVRGFTMRHPDIPEALRGTFAGLAHPAAIAHLKTLGITAVEVLPPCAWIEERHLAAKGITNYWGYNSVGFLAPDPRLAPGGWTEVREAVAALAAAGIETLVDIVLNHTGEGDDFGPTLSLRGLDNATYFRAGANDSGCGNTLALERPAPLRLAMDCLRAWATFGGVHGFRFDLATILGREADGFHADAPLLQAIEQDPLLSRLKMIAEPWDIGWGGYQLGQFPPRWGEWNDRFRDDIRSFWRGEPHRLGALATRMAGSADLFGQRRLPSRSVNFVTAHDGFTLADLVSYEHKHNEANGENNADGTNSNLSWNNGCEGPSDDLAIIARRLADQRALLAILLLARGTPMLSMGSEFGQTQAGNNNPYAQDNETSWLNWQDSNRELLTWTSHLLQLRGRHPAWRDDAFLSGRGPRPDVSWLRADGTAMQGQDWDAPDGHVLIMLLWPENAETRVGLILNRGETGVEITLPDPQDQHIWQVVADSANPAAPETLDPIVAAPRSVIAVSEIRSRSELPKRRSDAVTLNQLATAAGLAADWWETTGQQHHVGADTQRSVLKAMHLPADTTGEARDSLDRLAALRDRRALPVALVRRQGEPLLLPLALPNGHVACSEILMLDLQDGTQRTIRASAADAVIDDSIGIDGRPRRRWMLELPQLPIGRHRLRRERAPDSICYVTVAPTRCYLPEALAAGRKRFGLSAQLYTLRGGIDHGIGDFTTLREAALATAAAGGAVLGLNPMHALFAAQRERASPYQPSDRRFLDPIYLHLPEIAGPEARRLSALTAVDYDAVWNMKSAALEKRYQIHAAEDPGFTDFVAAGGPVLQRFAIFEAISETLPRQSWQTWPRTLHDPATPEVAAFAGAHADRVAYHCYLQYLCEQQLAEAVVPAVQGGLSIGFIRDLAVGCAPDGAEAWAAGANVAQGISVGAPPDPFSADGQVWGLPPPVPHLMATDGYASFAGLLEANMRHAGGLRIDHAMGLARLFWVPDGARGVDGTYVAYPFDDLLGQLAIESHRAKALVIGEDLGTVPNGLRQAMHDNDILAYRVLLLEREGQGFKPRTAYPTRAVACVSTHDLPTFVGWREGADIDERETLGQTIDATGEHAARAGEIAALGAALGTQGSDLSPAAHAFVAETASDLVYIQADDLAGERQAVNLPGTDRERPNWRRRLGVDLKTLFESPPAAGILDAVRSKRSLE